MNKNILDSIKNPLTVIAIFAGISEIAMTVTLINVPETIQQIFVWFVIIFPFVLVMGFFFVLYKKPGALFSPGDYQNQAMYLSSIGNQHNFDELTTRVNQLEQISNSLETYIGKVAKNAIPSKSIEIISEEEKNLKEIRKMHEVERNSLYSLLNKDLNLDMAKIRRIISASSTGYDLPESVFEVTHDNKGKTHLEGIITNFPKVLNDFDELKKFFEN